MFENNIFCEINGFQKINIYFCVQNLKYMTL